MLIKDLLEMKDETDAVRFRHALAELVRDEDEPELSEKALKDLIKTVAKKHGLSAADTKRLALAAEGPIGY